MAETKVDVSQRMTVDEGGKWQYPSTAGTGHDEIELPSLAGSANPTERLHVKDFGVPVAGMIESSMNRQGYMKSGVQQSPPQVLRHYHSVAKGAALMDQGALNRMETLVKEFEASAYRQEYYAQVLRPYLLSLSPERR